MPPLTVHAALTLAAGSLFGLACRRAPCAARTLLVALERCGVTGAGWALVGLDLARRTSTEVASER